MRQLALVFFVFSFFFINLSSVFFRLQLYKIFTLLWPCRFMHMCAIAIGNFIDRCSIASFKFRLAGGTVENKKNMIDLEKHVKNNDEQMHLQACNNSRLLNYNPESGLVSKYFFNFGLCSIN